MSEPVWNDAQLRAIEARGSDLLVAAAAGSGKTAVLVERLLRRVTREGIDVDRFLVVTFTRAAASEMLAKFTRRLTDAAAAAPDDRRLRRQLRLLPRAHVTTVHGFCASLLREHFQAAGLPPDFRVADESEAGALRARTLDTLLESRYDSGDPDFLSLVDALAAVRDDRRLTDIVQAAHARMTAHPDPASWAADIRRLAAEAAGTDPAGTACGTYLLSDARHILRYHAARYESALRLTEGDEPLAAYTPLLAEEAARLDALLERLETGTWDEVRDAMAAVAFGRLPSARRAAESDRAYVKAVRDGWKKASAALQQRFSRSAETVRDDAAAVLSPADALMRLVLDFDAAFTDAKRRRGLVDFADLEHLTLSLLRGPDGNPTPLAAELSLRFEEILVDEYQDTNAVQDAIFTVLARSNLFMVGDVKQSIYRFRLADPSIFLDRYNAYPDDAAEGQPRRVVLSANYRSRADVLDACNRLFSRLFSPALGELAYTEQEYLRPGRVFPETEADTAAELALIGGKGEDEDPAEPAWAAQRIARMVREQYPVTAAEGGLRPAKWGDFAILLRSFGRRAGLYREALEKRGIPCVIAGESRDLFSCPEVELVIALLTCIDNPRQDIPLAAAMRAPCFAFTADELAALRAASPDGSFHEAVFRAADAAGAGFAIPAPDEAGALPFPDAGSQPEPEIFRRAAAKAREMLTLLAELRLAAQTMPLGRFLWETAGRTALFTYVAAMDGADARRENLCAFFDLAYRFENAGYRGLYRFLQRIRTLRERGDTPETPGGAPAGDAVRIMSVHRSKGLQFPIVLLCGCGGRFNTESGRAPVLLHPKLGLGLRRRDMQRRIEYPTLAYNAIRAALYREMLSEELRVLYVAMTRAEEKLILTASVRDPAALLDRYAAMADDPMLCAPAALAGEAGFAGWLLRGLAVEIDPCWHVYAAAPEADPAEPEPAGPAAVPDVGPEPPDLPAPDTEALTWVYPHADAVSVPSKLTATSLARALPEQADAEPLPCLREAVKEPAEGGRRGWSRPRFIGQRGLTPAERGTALHLAMQFCRYEAALTPEGAAAELRRLEAEAFLTPEQAACVDPRRLVRFFLSPLGQRIRRAGTLLREFRFSLPVSPEAAAGGALAAPLPGGDSVLLQGVVDCCFAEDGAWVIVDFKTDALTAPGQALARYAPQLSAYAHAVTRITGLPVRECVLYLFSSGETASFTPSNPDFTR